MEPNTPQGPIVRRLTEEEEAALTWLLDNRAALTEAINRPYREVAPDHPPPPARLASPGDQGPEWFYEVEILALGGGRINWTDGHTSVGAFW